MTDIVITDADYDRMSSALEKIFATFPLELKGKKVLLKPNMVGAYPPQRSVTTHPSLVRECISSIIAGGAARVIVGDNPGVIGYGSSERVARACGIFEAAGEHYLNISRDAVEVPWKSEVAPTTIVSRAVLEADLFISLPRFKTHMQTLISGAIKNSYGILAGGEKAKFHYLVPEPEKFSRVVAEVYAIRPPDLVIMDAVRVMEGNGPSSRDIRPLGKLLASRDAVALDSLMAAMMGLQPEEVPLLKAAAELGLGETDLSKLTIEGEWEPLPGFKLPLSFARRGWLARVGNRLWGSLFSRTRLRINPKTCQRCGVCFAQCPAGAVEKSGPGFRINSSRCIHCYCCYELCVYGAVKIGGRLERLLKAVLSKREGF